MEGDILQTMGVDRRQLVIRQPVGVAGAITPWSELAAQALCTAVCMSEPGCVQTSPSAW